MENPSDDQIRQRAHALWEQSGRPEGRSEEFWHEAERELLGTQQFQDPPEGNAAAL
jgi:hypothetical protein